MFYIILQYYSSNEDFYVGQLAYVATKVMASSNCHSHPYHFPAPTWYDGLWSGVVWYGVGSRGAVCLDRKVYDSATLPDLMDRNLAPMGRRMLVSQLGQVRAYACGSGLI